MTCWTVLGIKRTRERGDIRRAYAAKLKATNPEDDAEGFKALRAAYEQALAYAGNGGTVPYTTPVEAKAPPRPETPVEIDAPVEPAPAPTELDLFHGAQRHLAGLLQPGAGADADRLHNAFDAVVHAPAMSRLDVRDQTETWLAFLLSANMPRSDSLIVPAIRYFGWSTRSLNRKTPAAVSRVLDRANGVAFLETIKRSESPHYRAWRILSAAPQPINLRSRMWTATFPGDIKALLDILHTSQRGLRLDFNAETLSRWEEFFTRPRLPMWGLWALAASLPCLVLVALLLALPADYHALAVFPCLPILAAIAALAYVYGYQVPARWWREHVHFTPRGSWSALGWWPAGLGLIGLAALPSSVALTLSVCGLSIACALWAAIAGEPDRRAGNVPWQLRALLGNAYVLIWWVLVVLKRPDQQSIPMSAALLCAVFGAAMGKLSLYRFWTSLSRLRQSIAIWTAVALNAATIAIHLAAQADHAWEMPAVAATLASVLVCRAVRIDGLGFNVRILWIAAVAIFNHGVFPGLPVVLIGAFILMIWNFVSLGMTWEDRRIPARG